MTNTAAFSAMDLRSIFGERAIVPDFHASVGVCTDSRALIPGSIFVALRGERFDGHDHIKTAVLQGCVAVLFEESWQTEWEADLGKTFPSFARIVVEDSLKGLAQLAKFHRQRFDIPVLAVAGANGKTTTKDLAAHVFSARWLCLKTEANFNNRVGTPLTLLQLTKFHEAAVIEIGTNEPGEIEVLVEMVQPTLGLITNIGEEHLEKLIDLDGVEQEETALYRYCASSAKASSTTATATNSVNTTGATAIVNLDDERLVRHLATLPKSYCFGSNPEVQSKVADLCAEISFDAELHPTIRLQSKDSASSIECVLSTVGYASALNALAALACGCAAGMSLQECSTALSQYQPAPIHGYARMQVQQLDSMPELTILNDCYNANPSSMRVALATLAAYPARKRIALLGDMRELGDATSSAHDEIVRKAHANVDLLVLVGNEMSGAAQRVVSSDSESHLIIANSSSDAAAIIKQQAKAGDVLLVKGSRGMSLEKVLEALS